MPTRHVVDAEPLLRPPPDELAVAPELGVLAALDAILSTAAYQLHAEHPELALDALARGDLPSAEARTASFIAFRCTELRAAIRRYHGRVLGLRLDHHDHEPDVPF